MKTPKTYQFSMTAHHFTREGGSVLTQLFSHKARVTVEAETLAELDTKITAFGKMHAPCNVWVVCLSKPKIRGFDAWNTSATRNLFEAPSFAADMKKAMDEWDAAPQAARDEALARTAKMAADADARMLSRASLTS